ncbi:MAG: hypothetical protein ACFFBP_21510 [Promethearchaeota archaeon]
MERLNKYRKIAIFSIFIFVFFFANVIPIYLNLIQISHINIPIKHNEIFDNPISSSTLDDYNLDWNLTLGGVYNDNARCITTDSQDNIYIAGWEDITGLNINRDILITKYNSSGELQWKKCWGGSNDDLAYDIIIDASDNIYVVGITKSYGDPNGDALIIKYNISGHQEWNMTWGGSNYDAAMGIDSDSINNFYIGGNTKSYGDIEGDAFLVKFNGLWIEQWNLTWGGDEYEGVADIHIDKNDSIYIAGRSNSIDPQEGEGDAFFIKYNSTGDLQWQQSWSGIASQNAHGITTSSDGYVYITGETYGHPVSSGMAFLLIYTSEGDYLWKETWGIIGEYGNCFYKMIFSPYDDPYIVGKTTFYRSYIANDVDAILLNGVDLNNPNWRTIWKEKNNDIYYNLCFDSKLNIYCIGQTNSYGNGGYDILLVKYEYYQIKMISPLNTTYKDYMEGYYPATYDFDNVKLGDIPSDWETIEIGDTSVGVVETKMGHYNVLEMKDADYSHSASVNHSFVNKALGTIEFWVMGDIDKGTFHFNLKSGNNVLFQLRWLSVFQYLQWWDGKYHNIIKLNTGTWYHIRIDFDCIKNSIIVKINNENTILCKFFSTPSSINGISFQTYEMEGDYCYYVDALAYSWDPVYNIGDNLKGGLLISFINRTNLDWIGYSLDNQPIESINRIKVISMPQNGSHHIKIVANDTSGLYYESETIYFTISIGQYNPPPPPSPPPTREVVNWGLIIFIIIFSILSFEIIFLLYIIMRVRSLY